MHQKRLNSMFKRFFFLGNFHQIPLNIKGEATKSRPNSKLFSGHGEILLSG
jgi:hypothetical protein